MAAVTLPTKLPLPTDLPIDLNLLRHELRTPLTGMLGLAELMSVMELPGQVPYWLATMQACGQQLASLIDRSLRSVQITIPAKPRAESYAETDSRCMLEQIICSHWPAAQAGHNKLLLIVAPEAIGHWQIDPIALRQALDNLLANAIRFTKAGYVTLEARVIPAAGDGMDSLLLIVENTGVEQQKVESNLQDTAEFAARTYPMLSRGLGLQVVEQVCLGHGGRLERYTNVAGGAGFSMFLPGAIRSLHHSLKPFQPGLFRKLRCLLLLDSPLERVIMAMLVCLDIRFELIGINQQGTIAGLPPGHVAICNPAKMLLPYQSLGQHPDPASLWLVAPMITANGTEICLQQLPEPLLQADLQTALLRCLVMQGQASAKATAGIQEALE